MTNKPGDIKACKFLWWYWHDWFEEWTRGLGVKRTCQRCGKVETWSVMGSKWIESNQAIDKTKVK